MMSVAAARAVKTLFISKGYRLTMLEADKATP
jgi:hypothetical protein